MSLSVQSAKSLVQRKTACASCGKQEFWLDLEYHVVHCNHCGRTLPRRIIARMVKNAFLQQDYQLFSANFSWQSNGLKGLRVAVSKAMKQISASANPELATEVMNAVKSASDASLLTKKAADKADLAHKQLIQLGGGVEIDKPGLWRVLNHTVEAFSLACLCIQSEIELMEEALSIAKGNTSTNIGSKQP